MARRIKAPTAPPVSRQVSWSEFATGDWWELKQGVDFDQDARKAARAARQWCSNNGYKSSCLFPDSKTLQIRIEMAVR